MNLVFDLAGVLLRWDPAALVARWMPAQVAAVGDLRAATAALFQHYGGDWAEFDRGTLDADGIVERIVRRTGWPAPPVRAVVDAVGPALQPDPAMLALLAAARRRGDRLFFLSNMPAPCAAHLERAHGFLGEFDGGVFSSRVRHIKPEAAIYALAADRFALPPAELCFFDDVMANVDGARACGWRAELFTDAARCARTLGL